ncbi:hypothetical protein [Micromonospora echinospora]|uniref:hypothetical protein n=1 Tax=Micromonospora echinospora TaxID=1877 RepID=UPI003A8AF389
MRALTPLTGKRHYLTETVPAGRNAQREAEKVRTRFLNEVDEKRSPRTRATLNQLLDKWLDVADIEPTTREPFSCWPLTKLRDYLIEAGYVTTVSVETVRRVLHERGVSWQATKTWKASTDPDFTAKMRRILHLYDHPPADGRVLCVNEFGPLNLQPRPGRGWRPAGQPVRPRATYRRDQGVRHMNAALDLATGRLHYRIRDRKR